MKKWIYCFAIICAIVLSLSAEATEMRCREPKQGPPGKPGTSSTGEHTFNFLATTESGASIDPRDPFFFNNGSTSGTAITFDGGSTFTFHQTGDYFVNFLGFISDVLPGGTVMVSLELNGEIVGPTIVLQNSDVLPLQQIIHITTVPSTLQVVNESTTQSLVLPQSGVGDTINIIKLS